MIIIFLMCGCVVVVAKSNNAKLKNFFGGTIGGSRLDFAGFQGVGGGSMPYGSRLSSLIAFALLGFYPSGYLLLLVVSFRYILIINIM